MKKTLEHIYLISYSYVATVLLVAVISLFSSVNYLAFTAAFFLIFVSLLILIDVEFDIDKEEEETLFLSLEMSPYLVLFSLTLSILIKTVLSFSISYFTLEMPFWIPFLIFTAQEFYKFYYVLNK